MEQNLIPLIITALMITSITIVALVAITYRQKDIATLALKILGQMSNKTSRGSQVNQKPSSAPLCPDGHGVMVANKKKRGSYYCPHVIAESAGKKIYCQQRVG